ncbi:MAG: bifunctional demethylmenaquinone methyltransferase/2-methoxy-6-polyprenyl-1,4-benzoquinol methylase UbiE [Xanthomonadales bacterium]|nr:bifunctional demethylmenaquinone methyltransferase/2-methoxy-6-polyprenyl-1,4-benzoquinol methylase UbiE [Xanthomonadales bacterium]NIN60104.1 bifunctional demethylmenaquinone methyltransferase/2-methoxy-6-polyprenyl-1,4-benzoquinol methylase UbiE [Xanthomonadales bacterium]NIN75474.1 bifunctional demethylmenaquinone methyltransferase/2-methoxy-6-polyprenyl-1,4-benzoquinol methylase UbiE [Xanthomonadales bacterium]NIO13570.1 bifunctional demethylmenaquinone methyltransferase/2-methoxy-6-polyp
MGGSKPGVTDFGYREVPTADKAGLVHAVFESVAPRYDLMNDLMSLGVHRLWKRHFVATSGIRAGDRVLDLAGGTGDVSALLASRLGPTGEVVMTDINPAMLELGRRRMEDRGRVGTIRYALADAEALPFDNAEFDAVTIAFGLRNVTDKRAALREMRRVLKPGGRALILEFSRVGPEPLQRLYDGYSFGVLPLLGRIVAGDADSYQYLAESIRQHPDQQTLAAMMRDAGFTEVGYRNLSAGIVAIHRGRRG